MYPQSFIILWCLRYERTSRAALMVNEKVCTPIMDTSLALPIEVDIVTSQWQTINPNENRLKTEKCFPPTYCGGRSFCWTCSCCCSAQNGEDVKDCPILTITSTASSFLKPLSESQAPHPQHYWPCESVYWVCCNPLRSVCCRSTSLHRGWRWQPQPHKTSRANRC